MFNIRKTINSKRKIGIVNVEGKISYNFAYFMIELYSIKVRVVLSRYLTSNSCTYKALSNERTFLDNSTDCILCRNNNVRSYIIHGTWGEQEIMISFLQSCLIKIQHTILLIECPQSGLLTMIEREFFRATFWTTKIKLICVTGFWTFANETWLCHCETAQGRKMTAPSLTHFRYGVL